MLFHMRCCSYRTIYYINSSFTLVRGLDRLMWLRLRARRASGAWCTVRVRRAQVALALSNYEPFKVYKEDSLATVIRQETSLFEGGGGRGRILQLAYD
jgi:hypothetical protein